MSKVLQIVLAYGNYLNGNTARGGAFAFKLDSLLKLMDVASTVDQKTSGLHYIVEIMLKHFPDESNLSADLHDISQAARYHIPPSLPIATLVCVISFVSHCAIAEKPSGLQ